LLLPICFSQVTFIRQFRFKAIDISSVVSLAEIEYRVVSIFRWSTLDDFLCSAFRHRARKQS
jgi:hypothetical protein